jgi:hypothetical protein
MRIRFLPATGYRDDRDPSGERGLERRIATFWNTAGGELSAFARRGAGVTDAPALERTLTAALDDVAPGLAVEVDALPDRKVRAVFSARDGGAPEPLVAEIIGKAPRSDRFTAVRYRPALPVDVALADVRARGPMDLAGARVRIGFSRGHLLEIVVFSHAVSSAADESALDAANMLVPRIVGEQVFDEWVGSIDVAPLARGGSLRVVNDAAPGPDAALPLTELRASVEAAVRGVDAELPEAPYHTFCERAEWTLLEMTPTLVVAGEDYAAQDDLAFLSTMLPECMKSFLQGAPFSSRRFSRWNERFAYVKIDVDEKSIEERHALRIELEDRLNALLVPGRAGCVVGAGLGLRYLYLELALERFDDGVRLVQKKLANLGVGPRAWILFCDTSLRDEWIGIGDDTLPPPRRDS